MAIRFIVEVAWQAHFVKNMFIQPSAEELENFKPDFVVYNASKAKVLQTGRKIAMMGVLASEGDCAVGESFRCMAVIFASAI